jgi:hypothetical protein
MNNTLNVLYNLVLSLWIGGISIFTFLMTPVIFRAFDRDMAGKIVGKLFPGYFLFLLILSFLALILLLAGRHVIASSGFKVSLALIVIALIMNVYVAFKLHPEMKQIKEEIHSFESLSPDSPLRKRFGKLHAVSAVLNLLLLADGVTLLIMNSLIKK